MNKKRFYQKPNIKKTEIKNDNSILSNDYKDIIKSQSYIGKKGYTIPKSILSKEDEEFLRKDLLVKPQVFGANYGGQSENAEFPVFRENTNKIYIPRFYGIQRYGVPNKTDIQIGHDISVEFSKQLRDYQIEIVDKYINYVSTPICSGSSNNGSGAILEVFCGAGKTVIANKIISILKKKTLILVHKEFLMNQWIERIEEFLPGAKIGKIQAQVFDIEDKDIVIGMIQTLYDKEYSSDTFSSFGLTIIDEVHRIGSEQFSKTLFKTITPYMLGISATVDRKDKLTKILYMFIGEKIYSKKREADDLVCVRAINYHANDTEFNEVETDFRGNVKYSSMIVKLCDYGPRSDFIIRIIKDLISEEPSNQIMILCHNRSLLSYLYEGINHRNIASVGYYVGGMKQKNLQETESKCIVLATYAMAAEALDIKTLNTLVMVTPKTDITQSVGRILREKHENPIIVDIIDSHDIFQNQWAQRRRFYKKSNYRIRQIDSKNYTNMSIDWQEHELWRRVFEPNLTDCSNKKDSDDEGISQLKSNVIGKCLINIAGLDEVDN
jgi:superfamily II DNA or RNA helicase